MPPEAGILIRDVIYCYRCKTMCRTRLNKIDTLSVQPGNMNNTEMICLLARSKLIHPYFKITMTD